MEEAIRATVEQYCRAWGARDRDAWVAAFAPEAVQEDPIGSPPRRGHDGIGRFFDEALARWSEGLTLTPERLHVNGAEAALVWRIDAAAPGEQVVFHGVDVFAFDPAGRIASVRAYWQR